MRSQLWYPQTMGMGVLPYGRQSIGDDDIEAVVEVLRGDFLTTGPVLPQFERAVADRVDADWAVGLSSGTAALHAACHALELGAGDEVLVPAISFVASANCARYVGAEPVFVDVDPDTGLVDVTDVQRRLTANTAAVVAVHLTGAAADVAAIARLTDAPIIEDAAHALGARAAGAPVGACAHSAMTTFSFHPVKTVTCGEGGAVTGNHPRFAERLRAFRHHGIVKTDAAPWHYEQRELGYNYRLSDIHAALGLSQLAKLDGFLAKRRHLTRHYARALAGLEGVRPVNPGADLDAHGLHLYSVLIEFAELGADRAAVMTGLRERGIGSQVHYIPIPAHPYYLERGWRMDDFPGAAAYYRRTLSLPLYPAMTTDDVDRVVSALHDALAASARKRTSEHDGY